MTRDEAKSVLFDMLGKGIYVKNTKENQAILAALRALEQKPCEDWYDVPSDEMTLGQARQAVKDLRKKLAEHLEQEPCGKDINVSTTDAISRQAVLECLDWYEHDRCEAEIYIREIVEDIKKLPPITPQPKTGHWIYTGDYITEGMLKCSSCGYEHDVADRFSYCPNCGAKMKDGD